MGCVMMNVGILIQLSSQAQQDVWYKFNAVNEKSNCMDTIDWENEKGENFHFNSR